MRNRGLLLCMTGMLCKDPWLVIFTYPMMKEPLLKGKTLMYIPDSHADWILKLCQESYELLHSKSEESHYGEVTLDMFDTADLCANLILVQDFVRSAKPQTFREKLRDLFTK